MQRHLVGLILIFSILFSKGGIAQSDSLFYWDKPAAKKLILAEGVVAVVSLSALSFIWYNELQTPFHFFNDGNEWGSMDKLGHFTGAAWATEWNVSLMQQAGIPAKKARLYAASATMGFLSFVEVLDGFSPKYGASVYDMVANASGTAFGLAHSAGYLKKWEIKFSFTQTPYAQYRPNLLGDNLAERWLKDYNGQTYWLSYFPTEKWSWLGISVGYGIDGYTGAKSNPIGTGNFTRSSQWYLSPDIRLSHLFKKGTKLRQYLRYLDFIKVPLPGLMLNNGKVQFKGLVY